MRARRIGRTSPSPISMSGLMLTAEDSVEGLKKQVSRLRKRNKILVVLSLIIVVLVSLIVFSPLLVPNVKASLALDGSTTAAYSGVTISLSLSTTTSNDVIIVIVGTDDYSGGGTYGVSGISGGSLTWNKRCAKIGTYDLDQGWMGLDEWYTTWSSHGTLSITVTLAAGPGVYGLGCAFGVSGADTAAIFDGSTNFTSLTNSANPSVQITTSNANDFIFGLETSTSGGTPSAGSGFSGISLAVNLASEDKIVSATQSKLPVGFTLTTGYWFAFADAIKQGATTDYPPTYTTIGSNETIAGNPVKCYVLWVQNSSAPSYFILGTNNTGTFTNQTAAAVSSNWGNYSFTLNTTVGVKVQWEEWCNDTGGSWNNTGLQTITTTYYASITVNTGTHSWSINPAQNNVTITENSGKISLTVTSNAAFDIGAKASGDLTYGANSISLTNTNMSATTWSVAIPLTTSYQTVPGLSNVGSGTGLSENVYLWLSCPMGKPAGAYTETITFEIVATGGSY